MNIEVVERLVSMPKQVWRSDQRHEFLNSWNWDGWSPTRVAQPARGAWQIHGRHSKLLVDFADDHAASSWTGPPAKPHSVWTTNVADIQQEGGAAVAGLIRVERPLPNLCWYCRNEMPLVPRHVGRFRWGRSGTINPSR